MNSLVFKKKINGAATHALVIGVGHYHHLPGGKSKKKYAGHGGMGQLKSPPMSAKAIARWLIEEYKHPQKPLASVSLLVSEINDAEFAFKKGKTEKTVTVPSATRPEVENAIRDWHALGNQNPDHLLLFFFCGHGIARGTDLALLLADFGAVDNAPLDGAFDFRRLRQNMDECAAREQCYFVDACRVGSGLLIDNDGFAGNPIIQRTGATNNSGRFRQAPVFYSTLAGAEAYAETSKPSLYTLALLEAFAGAGAGDEEGPWRVRTGLLHDALGFLVKEESQRLQLPQLQISPSDDLSSIDLNVVNSPQVPVVVNCLPSSANEKATLRCEGPNYNESRNPHKDPWRLRLPIDTYAFHAELSNTSVAKRELLVRPAFRRVSLEVKS
jgi:hypothetical protein